MSKLVLPPGTRFYDVPVFIGQGDYKVNVAWNHIDRWFEQQRQCFGDRFQLDPDFQRDHVWTKAKQTAYVEFVLRGGRSAKEILWNSPGWTRNSSGPEELVLVDGKQRLEAVRRFLNGEIEAFGLSYSQFAGPKPLHCDFVFCVNELQSREDVLRWYLEINSGGVVHTAKELRRVRKLLEKEQAKHGKDPE